MRKTFPLQIEGRHPDRVLDAIRHDIRKALKRQIAEGASITTPEGVVVDLTQYREAAKKA